MTPRGVSGRRRGRPDEPADIGLTFVAGSSLAFDDFFRAHHARLVALAGAVTGSRISADDIAQEALVIAAKRWDEVGGFDDPGAWVRRVVVNLSISRRRRLATETKTRLRLVAETPLVADAHEPTGDDEIWAAVAELPPKQRAAVALHYLEGHDAASIAQILDCAPATARVHLHRGRTALAARLAPQEA